MSRGRLKSPFVSSAAQWMRDGRVFDVACKRWTGSVWGGVGGTGGRLWGEMVDSGEKWG